MTFDAEVVQVGVAPAQIGREAVKLAHRAAGKFDVYCQNKYRDNAVLIGAWKSASRLELRRVHRKRTV